MIRGIHFTEVPPGQAKYVFCPSGALPDVIVDLRVGSPTFLRWEAVRLDETSLRAAFLEHGLGHAFMTPTPAAKSPASAPRTPGHCPATPNAHAPPRRCAPAAISIGT